MEKMDGQADPYPTLTCAIRAAGAMGIFIGGFWLVAWLTGWAPRQSASGLITMKTNMALGQMLSGAALLLLWGGAVDGPRRAAGKGSAILVLLIGALTFSQHLFGFDLGIDQLLASEPPGATATVSPNRIGPPGSLSLALLGTALLALAFGRRAAASSLGLAVCAINLVPAVGFLYGIRSLYGLSNLTAIAWPSVVALVFLGIGLVLSYSEGGPIATLLRQDAGGTALRKLLPAAILVPLALGFLWVLVGSRGLVKTPTDTGLFVIASILVFSFLLWHVASRLSREAAVADAANKALEQSKDRLRQRAEELETVLENVPAIVWIAHDPDCHHITGNRAADEVLQLPHGKEASLTAPVGKRPTHFKVIKDGRVLGENELPVQRSARGEVVSDIEFSVAFDDGVVRHMVGNASPLYDAQGRPRGSVSAFIDITDRKAVEEELRRAYEELEERVRERTVELGKAVEDLRGTTQMLQELVQSSPLGIVALDVEGKVTLWNPAMERTFGWKQEEALGNPMLSVAEGDQEKFKSILARLFGGESISGMELHLHCKNRVSVYVNASAGPVRDAYAHISGVLMIFADITRAKVMEQIALAQQQLVSLGQMAAGIAHEVRNPLSGLNIYVGNLERSLGDADIPIRDLRAKTKIALAGIMSASARMETIIARVLSFSRPGPARMEPIDVNACIRDAVNLAEMSPKKAGTHVEVTLQEDLPRCRGDVHLIGQALINIITNATQALERMEGERVIEIRSSMVGSTPGDHQHVTISVADSGPGIPETLRERIFHPFFSTKSSGTGIGLSITRKIISDHGGFIRVETSGWGGALFTVGLPAVHKGELSD
jgi:PAS domain S-box-containing protein